VERLKIELEGLVEINPPQIKFESIPLLRARIHFLFKEAIGTATLILGSIKRKIGIFQQRIGIEAIARRHRKSNARGHGNNGTIHLEWLVDGIDYLLS